MFKQSIPKRPLLARRIKQLPPRFILRAILQAAGYPITQPVGHVEDVPAFGVRTTRGRGVINGPAFLQWLLVLLLLLLLLLYQGIWAVVVVVVFGAGAAAAVQVVVVSQ